MDGCLVGALEFVANPVHFQQVTLSKWLDLPNFQSDISAKLF